MSESFLQNHYNFSDTECGYEFVTKNGVVYLVSFVLYPVLNDDASFSFYSFNIDRCSEKKGQDDIKVRNTVAFILNLFFEKHNDAIITVTDCSDSKQAARRRLFSRWFEQLSDNQLGKIEGVVNIENKDIFVSLLYRAGNSETDNMISAFKSLIDNNLYYD